MRPNPEHSHHSVFIYNFDQVSSILMFEGTYFSETSLSTYKATRCKNPKYLQSDRSRWKVLNLENL